MANQSKKEVKIINPSVQKTSYGNRIENQNYGQKRFSTFLYDDQKMGGEGHYTKTIEQTMFSTVPIQ